MGVLNTDFDSRSKRLARYRRYREKNRDKRNAEKREWYRRNAAHVKEYQKAWMRRQPKQYWKRWNGRENENPNGRWPNGGRTYKQSLEANKYLRRKQRQTISDSYLRGWMSRTTRYAIKPSEWPADLVEAKRAQLKLTRLCRKSRTTTN